MSTEFKNDMGNMVRESKASESQKSMAMSYVRTVGDIMNGSREDVGRISDSLGALTPIILEIYLRHAITLDEVKDAIAEHLTECPAGKLAIINMRKGDDVDGNNSIQGLNWQRMLFSLVTGMRWPGAVVTIAIMFKDEISKLLLGG